MKEARVKNPLDITGKERFEDTVSESHPHKTGKDCTVLFERPVYGACMGRCF
jgi:hypothetical protein